jgi:hypothetical protein
MGPTSDEPGYIQAGLEFWNDGTHQWTMRMGTMPLPVDVQGFPGWVYEQWTGRILDPVDDLERILPWARAANLVFWWVLLVYAMLIGRKLGGAWGGRLAVALVACEPSMLAHAALATTDISISALLLAFVYYFQAGRDGTWAWRAGVPGLLYGVAILAKASALAFCPLCMLAVEVDRLWRQGSFRSLAGESIRGKLRDLWALSADLRRDAWPIAFIGLTLTFVYCGSDWKPEKSFIAWTEKLPEGALKSTMSWTANRLTVFPNAGDALVRQIRHNMRGHGAYLLGGTWPRAVWYYFPVVLSMKLSIPLLLAPLVLLTCRPRSLVNWAMLAAGALLLFSLNSRVQIGVRLMLPLIALWIVGLSAAAATTFQQWESRAWRIAGGAAALACVLWTTVDSVRLGPQALCYCNAFYGSVDEAYTKLSDSNYDWGQGFPELERWRQKAGWDDLTVWYFGNDPRAGKRPYRYLFTEYDIGPSDRDVSQWVRGKRLAVGATFLYGSYTHHDWKRLAEHLRQCKPVDRTTTFFIYDFTDQAASTTKPVSR